MVPENRHGRRGVYSIDLMADFAVAFLQDHRERPFFLYLPFTLPHARMEVPELGAYAERTDWPERTASTPPWSAGSTTMSAGCWRS